jgi:hypothetical protein
MGCATSFNFAPSIAFTPFVLGLQLVWLRYDRLEANMTDVPINMRADLVPLS